MNLKMADAAIAAYQRRWDDSLSARLQFFRGMWGALEPFAARAAERGWWEPSAEDVAQWHRDGTPVFAQAPAPVDAEDLAAAAAAVGAKLAEHEGFGVEARAALADCDWRALVDAGTAELAGRDPGAFLDAAGDAAADLGEGASLAMAALALALRSQLESASAQAARMAARAAAKGAHPLTCPVCGGAPTIAVVGPTPSGLTNGRQLWCGQCGAAWEFDRVRCVRCGTQNQAHLHYHSLEGDDSHRIHRCDECGGYVRTRFVEQGDLGPMSFEVEDVAMANLDVLAQQVEQRSE